MTTTKKRKTPPTLVKTATRAACVEEVEFRLTTLEDQVADLQAAQTPLAEGHFGALPIGTVAVYMTPSGPLLGLVIPTPPWAPITSQGGHTFIYILFAHDLRVRGCYPWRVRPARADEVCRVTRTTAW